MHRTPVGRDRCRRDNCSVPSLHSIARFWYPQSYHNFHSWPNAFFDLEIRRKSCLLAALIYSHPLFHFPNPFQTLTQLCHRIELIRTIPTIYISTPYLFWKARYGTCRLFVYTFLLGNPFESGYVSYVVRKVFSRGSQRS